jgi:carbamoyl-phosphate synthase large subunit
VDDIHDKTAIAFFFLDGFKRLVQMEQQVKETSFSEITASQLAAFKQVGFSDEWLASVWGIDFLSVRAKRKQFGIFPSYKMVDTCAAEFEAQSAYYYSSWHGKNDVTPSERKKILVLGSGPIRIGQGIEFDYCSVHAVQALQEKGYETIIVNNNPETVSTDYALADRLYFEPLALEDVLNVIEFENVEGVVAQVGGQTAITLVKGLEAAGIPVLGVNQQTMDELEDRDLFYRFMEKINVPHIPGLTATNAEDLINKADQIGYPVLLRPSYVIGGRGMVILSSREELKSHMKKSLTDISYPILIDAYVPGTEAEVDVLTDGEDVLIPGIFEHVEKAGVHSGDSTAVTPPFSLSATVKSKIAEDTKRIARAMDFKGIFNIQFVIDEEKVYVLEINPRASRTVPVLSKVYGVDMIGTAVGLMLGEKLTGAQTGLLPENRYYTVKRPVFSTVKLPGVDPILCPEMKSTGEVISIAEDAQTALNHTAELRTVKEVFCEIDKSEWGNFTEISDRLYEAGVTLVSDDQRFARCFGLTYVPSFEDWVKSKNALMFISVEKPGGTVGKDKRILAVRHRLTVITDWTQLESLFAQGETKNEPHSIGEWLRKNEGSLIH